MIVENVPMKRPAPKAVIPSIEHSLFALISSSIAGLLSYIYFPKFDSYDFKQGRIYLISRACALNQEKEPKPVPGIVIQRVDVCMYVYACIEKLVLVRVVQQRFPGETIFGRRG